MAAGAGGEGVEKFNPPGSPGGGPKTDAFRAGGCGPRPRPRRPELLDALTLDQDRLVGEDRAGASIHQATRLDQDGLGSGGGGRGPGREPPRGRPRAGDRRGPDAPGPDDPPRRRDETTSTGERRP